MLQGDAGLVGLVEDLARRARGRDIGPPEGPFYNGRRPLSVDWVALYLVSCVVRHRIESWAGDVPRYY